MAKAKQAKKPRQLDRREKQFVAEYLVSLDPQQAALAAQYSKTMARSKAYQWVSNGKVKPHVYAAVEAAMQARAERTEITADRVLRELAAIGFADMGTYMTLDEDGAARLDLSKLPAAATKVISEITQEVFMDGKGDKAVPVRRTRFKLYDKRQALVDIGRHLGMFKDVTEHVGNLSLLSLVGQASEADDEERRALAEMPAAEAAESQDNRAMSPATPGLTPCSVSSAC